jgi:hypothetical protein
VRRLKQLVCAFFLGTILCGTAGAPAMAQGPVNATAEQEREYEAAFQDMLRRPADLDVLFKFATIATRTGDYEGAISALERMLLVNPDLPRVRLELAVLYYRLGSFEVSRTYLETVLASPGITPEVRARAQQYLAEVEKRSARSRFVGEVFAGVRYQSNANLGPPTSSVRLFGQTANLNQSAIGTADWGVVGSGYVRHIYDLGGQDKGALETQLTGYANRQFQLSQANVSILDLTSGPRFQAFQGIFEDVTIKPLMSLGYIWVNDVPYYGSYGSGVEFRLSPADVPGQLVSAVQQPLHRQRVVGQHDVPVRLDRGRGAVRQRQRPALYDRQLTAVQLRAAGRRRRHAVPLRRSAVQEPAAMEHLALGEFAVVELRRTRRDRRPEP